MEKVAITTPTINLDQFLKWCGVVDTGGQVKIMLDDGMIKLNGTKVTERRKKIRPGDVIEIEEVGAWMVTAE